MEGASCRCGTDGLTICRVYDGPHDLVPAQLAGLEQVEQVVVAAELKAEVWREGPGLDGEKQPPDHVRMVELKVNEGLAEEGREAAAASVGRLGLDLDRRRELTGGLPEDPTAGVGPSVKLAAVGAAMEQCRPNEKHPPVWKTTTPTWANVEIRSAQAKIKIKII